MLWDAMGGGEVLPSRLPPSPTLRAQVLPPKKLVDGSWDITATMYRNWDITDHVLELGNHSHHVLDDWMTG